MEETSNGDGGFPNFSLGLVKEGEWNNIVVFFNRV